MSRKRGVGDLITIDFGVDHLGRHWWHERGAHGRHGGPFNSFAEAERASEITLLGPECKVVDGGMRHKEWDELQ